METKNQTNAIIKFLLFSALGIFMFFIPITIGESSTIPLDHIVSWIRANLLAAAVIYGLLITALGGLWPWFTGEWKKSTTDTIFSVFKLAGIAVALLVYFKIGPDWMMAPSMGPFLLEKLVVPVGLIVPIGAVFLSFLIGYGLLEFIGTLLRPVMRLIWKTPGRSAIDAVASFVGSYSIGLLITNKVLKEGRYSHREAAIIATGFSTVSATFMIIVANTLGLMDRWNMFFWSTLAITFIVTALTARVWPLTSIQDEYIGTPNQEKGHQSNLLKAAWDEGIAAAGQSSGLLEGIYNNLKDGFKMAMAILPTIMSIGLLGLVLAEFTPIFDWVAWIFYPFTALLQVPEAFLVAKASAIEIAEMFLPALLVTDAAPLAARYVTGVVSIAAILFFSASIPCILSTEIDISVPKMLIIWVERTILSIVLAGAFALLVL